MKNAKRKLKTRQKNVNSKYIIFFLHKAAEQKMGKTSRESYVHILKKR